MMKRITKRKKELLKILQTSIGERNAMRYKRSLKDQNLGFGRCLPVFG